jgi:hypothetical protein
MQQAGFCEADKSYMVECSAKIFTFSLVQCCVSGSGRIGIILPDPDPYQYLFQPNVKLD